MSLKAVKIPLWVTPITLVAKIYLQGILFFTIFRFLFLILNWSQVSQIENNKFYTLLCSFLMGWRFDTVVSMYILAIPTLIFLSTYHFHTTKKFAIYFLYLFCALIFPLTFLISAADIPYYEQFGNRFNTMAFTWLDNPKFVIGMILGEVRYWIFAIPLIGFIWFWVRIMMRQKKRQLKYLSEVLEVKISLKQAIYYALSSLFLIAIMFLGMRGRIEKKSPIRIGTAFFSNYNFPNQMALNPSFTLLRSWLDDLNDENKLLSLIDDNVALLELQKQLNITQVIPNESPIARQITDSVVSSKPNVILVIMESMSAAKMKKYGNPLDLTPNLERLGSNGYFFNNIYTAGIHTYNGIFSTLYSFPALLKKHPMNEFPTPIYTGLPGILKENGYNTTFFLTHDDQFDNMGGFLKANHFDQIISQKDYPSKEVLSTLGVPDHFMFEFAIQEISKKQFSKKPFFAAFMTGSDHGPFIIPNNISFKAKSSDTKTAIVEYADWAIGHLIELAKKQSWYNNTIFVFVADHGYSGNSPYEISLDYHHTPFIIYSPKYIPVGKEFNQIGLQIDVSPTVLGLMHINYTNNTPGINLLKESRKFATFSSDDKIGCINDSMFSVIRPDKSMGLYRYKEKSTADVLTKNKSLADSMIIYSYSLLQASQWLIKNKYTSQIGKK